MRIGYGPIASALCSRRLRIRDLGVIGDAELGVRSGLNVRHRRDRSRQDDGRHRPQAAVRRPGRRRPGAPRRRRGERRRPARSCRLGHPASCGCATRAASSTTTDCARGASVTRGGRPGPMSAGRSTPVACWPSRRGFVAVHGQSDQLRLTRPAEQRRALDRYAGIDPGAVTASAFGSGASADDGPGRPARGRARDSPRGRPADARAGRDRRGRAAAGEDVDLAARAVPSGRGRCAAVGRPRRRTTPCSATPDDPASDAIDVRTRLTPGPAGASTSQPAPTRACARWPSS